MLKRKILFVVEKNSQITSITKTNIYKNLNENNEIEFHIAHCVVPYFKYNYPNKIKYNKLPYINNLDYKLVNDIKQKETSPYTMAINDLNKNYLSSFDIIIFALDLNETSCYQAYLEFEQILGINFEILFQNLYFINTSNMEINCLDKEISNVIYDNKEKNNRMELFYQLINSGKIKKYFDYNYQINLNILIKEVYKEIFLDEFENNKNFEEIYSKYGFTKYMILTLFVLKSHNIDINLYIDNILKILDKYKGSGKYNSNIGIGSVASRAKIIENLVNLKCLERNQFNKIKENVKLNKFLELLNKKLYDPDLPFRIEKWSKLPFNKIKDRIDLYLLEVFKKQLKLNKINLKKGNKIEK